VKVGATGGVVLPGEEQTGAYVQSVGELIVDGEAEAATGFVACEGVDGREVGRYYKSKGKGPVYFEGWAAFWAGVGRCLSGVCPQGGVTYVGVGAQAAGPLDKRPFGAGFGWCGLCMQAGWGTGGTGGKICRLVCIAVVPTVGRGMVTMGAGECPCLVGRSSCECSGRVF